MVKAENALVRILEKEDTQWVSTFPTTVINNACGEENVKNLMMRTERFALAVADGFSRCSNGKRFGVCSVQGGMNAVGAHMAYPALAQAFEDSTPLLCITDGIPPQISGMTRYDITEAFRSVTKWIGYVNQAHRVPEFMTRAFTYLRSGRPGPVLIQLPTGLGEFDESEYPYHPVKGWKYKGDPKDVRIAVRALLAAKRPLIYAGQGIFYADACDELRKFAELVQAPVLTSLKGKSAFPEDHPLSLGVMGTPAERFLQGSDLVFAVGCSLSPGRRYGGFKHHIPNTKRSDLRAPAGKIMIQCTIDEMDINRYYQIDHAIIGDAKLVLGQLIAEVEEQKVFGVSKEKLLAEIQDARKEKWEKYVSLMTSNEKPISPYRVYQELSDSINRKNSFVTHDSGSTREQLAMVYEALIPHGFMGWGTVSTLGFGLGAAAGAKLAFPERQVVNVVGDAGLAYQLSDYESLVRNRLAVTTVHINNSGFSGYGPGLWGPGSAPYTAEVTPSAVQKTAEAVESLGEYAERVEDPDDVAQVLRRAFKENMAGRPAFIEVICAHHPLRGWLTQ